MASRIHRTLLLAVFLCGLQSLCGRVAQADEMQEVFFEKRVRPILVEHCQACHGSKKQEAALRLDSASALKKGGDSGAVVVPGDPENSPLIHAVRYAEATRMPPKGKLPDASIQILTTWVKQGAYWPADPVGNPIEQKPDWQEVTRKHWAFQPVPEVPVPEFKKPEWVKDSIDAFIRVRLNAAKIEPNPPADRRTLIRRATFDLHGLPPTPAEVAAFEADSSDDAFATVVNRLLDSPRYGERWARHWLDVARYSDTRGYVRLRDNPNYHFAWTYRDYVIRAFNEDLPYDQFILQQLAADQLPHDDDPRSLAAMGFLTLGQRFINSQHDIIDDRIDVVSRGLLGLSVACARCHDHKFDPIPTRDYYGLHGIFSSSLEPFDLPVIATQPELTRYLDYIRELQQRTAQYQQFLETHRQKFELSFRNRIAEYLLAGQKEEVQANFLAVMFLVDLTKDLNPVTTQRWARLLEQTRKHHHPVLAPWNGLAALATTAGDEFATQAQELIATWQRSPQADRPMNPLVLQKLKESSLKNLEDVARGYGELFQQADEKWQAALKADSSVKELEGKDWEELRQLLYGPQAPSVVALDEIDEFFFVDASMQNQFHEQQRKIEDWLASANAAPHAHVLVDSRKPRDSHIFLRGNASNPGPAAARQFLAALSRESQRPFETGSGRLELARAITDRNNPLTARVFVNRIWMHHFGAGLVRTPSDFGLRGEPPTHPELLDHLARQFMDEGWSLKKLHRHVMLSSTYQQSSAEKPAAVRIQDPENRLLSRMSRRRLDWESLRDSLLAVSGEIDLTMGGRSVTITTQPYSRRRSVYGFVDRQNLPGIFRTFDFATPETSNPQRHQTTVPQQALFLLNSPFLKQQTLHLAVLPELTSIEPLDQRIDAVHRRLFGRPAQPTEIELATRFLTAQPDTKPEVNPANPSQYLTPWEEYLQALLLSNEFAFVD